MFTPVKLTSWDFFLQMIIKGVKLKHKLKKKETLQLVYIVNNLIFIFNWNYYFMNRNVNNI